MIPLVNSTVPQSRSPGFEPWLGGAIRWIVVVLALVATADAAYLTWSSFSHGVVAGCDGMGHGGCDEVLNSRWSRVVGIPVALGGLLCYGTILAMALVAGTRAFNDNWILGTILASAALVAALSGLWFTGLQVVQLGAFCYYCLAIHACGLAMAGLVLWSALRGPSQNTAASLTHASTAGMRTTSSATHASLAAIPGARRTGGSRSAERPSWGIAAPLAMGLVALLIGVQVVFPTRMFDTSQPNLAATIDMTATADAPADSDELSPDAEAHVVNRPTDEPLENEDITSAQTSILDDGGEETAEEEPASKDSVVEDEAPKLSREVTFLNGKIKLDMYKEAVLGSPDAEHVVVEMMDYTCPHCRKMHAHIREALHRYRDQVAVVVLPVPLELTCNKLVAATDPMHRGACKIAKTSITVADVDPSRFVDFHNYLLANEEKPPTASQAVVRAFRLVDRKELLQRGGSPEIEARIQKYIQLYSALAAERRGDKTFGLPVQILGDTVLSGGDMTSEEMFEAWEKALNLPSE